MEEKLKTVGELIENCAQVCKMLSASEIAMNDGEVEDCQKNIKGAQSLLSTMVGDVFEEIKEEFGIETEDVNDYDLPNNLELIKQLSEVVYGCGVYVGLLLDNQTGAIIITIQEKIVKAINTVVQIYNELYNN